MVFLRWKLCTVCLLLVTGRAWGITASLPETVRRANSEGGETQHRKFLSSENSVFIAPVVQPQQQAKG